MAPRTPPKDRALLRFHARAHRWKPMVRPSPCAGQRLATSTATGTGDGLGRLVQCLWQDQGPQTTQHDVSFFCPTVPRGAGQSFKISFSTKGVPHESRVRIPGRPHMPDELLSLEFT